MYINFAIPTLLGCYSNDKIMSVAKILQNEVHRVRITAIINNGKSLKLPKCLTRGAQLNEQRYAPECYVVTKTMLQEFNDKMLIQFKVKKSIYLLPPKCVCAHRYIF